jgi:hypothetical protein
VANASEAIQSIAGLRRQPLDRHVLATTIPMKLQAALAPIFVDRVAAERGLVEERDSQQKS